MSGTTRVLHYLNQFFGGIGGEEQAYTPVEAKDGPVGPGQALQKSLGGEATVAATIVAGDNYFTEEAEEAKAAVGQILDRVKPDVVVAGPAFDAGRYGLACAEVCRLALDRGIPAVTGMHPDNPGVLMHRRDIVAVPTGASATEMPRVLENVARLALKLVRGEDLGPAQVDGYVARGVRRQVIHERPGYQRAVDMLMARLAGEPHSSEMSMTTYEAVPAAPPIGDLSRSTIALVSSGGVVPRGNMDGLVGARAEQFFRYDIDGVDALTVEEWESVHGGFSTLVLNNKDPNYAMPLSLARRLQDKGAFNGLYRYIFTTTGNGTAVSSARRMGEEIAAELNENHVDGVVLVAT